MENKFIFSPSNLKTFVQCPYKFKAMNIDKSVPYVQNEAAKRGEHLHELMEQAVKTGWNSIVWDDEKSRANAKAFIDSVWALKNNGWVVETEASIAMTRDGKPVDYFDKKDNYLRCRIDLWAVHPQKDLTIILDWKSGQVYEADKLQLQANALCMQAQFKASKYMIGFAYLDNGKVKYENIDVKGVDLTSTDPLTFATSPCLELMLALDNANHALQSGKFLQNKNRFCRWCPVTECAHSGK